MLKIILLVVFVTILRHGKCYLRSQSDLPTKFARLIDAKVKAESEIRNSSMDDRQEKRETQAAADDFLSEATQTLNLFKRGVVNNTRDNEAGKRLVGVSQKGEECIDRIRRILLSDPDKIDASLIDTLNRFVNNLAPAFKSALAEIANSTKNNALAISSLMEAVDNSLFLFTKLYVHLKFKKDTNEVIQHRLTGTLSQTLANLNSIPNERYKVKELAIHSRQLKFLLHKIEVRINNWLLQSHYAEGQVKESLEEASKSITKLVSDIDYKISTKYDISNLMASYRNWLGMLSNLTDSLVKVANEHDDGIIRIVLFDTFGIIVFYKTEFEILSQT